MANYKIIGADLMESGPVSAEQIRRWIAEGRVDAETKLQTEGTAERKPLAEVPEFAAASPADPATPLFCPRLDFLPPYVHFESMDQPGPANPLGSIVHNKPVDGFAAKAKLRT